MCLNCIVLFVLVCLFLSFVVWIFDYSNSFLYSILVIIEGIVMIIVEVLKLVVLGFSI